MSSLFEQNMVDLHLIGGNLDGTIRPITLAAVQDRKTVDIVTGVYRIEWNSGKMRWEGHYIGKLHTDFTF